MQNGDEIDGKEHEEESNYEAKNSKSKTKERTEIANR
jgi:hypothetical protein